MATENIFIIKREEFMRKDLEQARAEGVVFPEFALDRLTKMGNGTKVPNQVFMWMQLIRLNSFQVEITLGEIKQITGLSPNTIKEILTFLNEQNIIIYHTTKDTRSNKVKLVHVPVSSWFNKKEAGE